MQYLGHFSFFKGSSEGEEHYGYFTCVAEAPDSDGAFDKFEALLQSIRTSEELLDDVDEVFMDACIEIRQMPSEGFLAYFEELTPAPTSSMSTALRMANEQQVGAYAWGPDEDDDDEDATYEPVPFVVFDDEDE